MKVSISQEGIESYRKQTREKGISGRVVAKGNKESVISQAKQAVSVFLVLFHFHMSTACSKICYVPFYRDRSSH
ncbi:hypothetical protein IMSAGC018_02089 [Lachnospiraceae bacterium]|nr:hypothetical protein IMSAGC018_02089 [Lachnospiraceae bacterium]